MDETLTSVTPVAASAPRRQRWKTAFAILALLVAALVVNGFMFRTKWVPLLPDAPLVYGAGLLGQAAQDESLRRAEEGLTSDNLTRRIIARQLGDVVLEVEPPIPANKKLHTHIQYGGPLSLQKWKLEFRGVVVKVDGQVLDQPPPKAEEPKRKHPSVKHCMDIAPLSKGPHALEIAGSILVKRPGQEQDLGEYPFRVMEELKIDGSLDELVKMSCTKKEIKEVKSRLVADVWHNSSSNRSILRIVEAPIPIPIRGAVWVKLGLESDRRRIGEIRTECAPGHTVMMTHTFDLGAVNVITKYDRIEVQIVPDLDVAYKYRSWECFGGIIQWDDLAIPRANGVHQGTRPPRHPSEIRSIRSKKAATMTI